MNCEWVVFVSVRKKSFEIYLDEKDEANGGCEDGFLRLSKMLQSAIVIRGARLSVKAILDVDSYVSIHQDCITWLFQQTKKEKVGVMFKGLIHLTVGMDGRAALKM